MIPFQKIWNAIKPRWGKPRWGKQIEKEISDTIKSRSELMQVFDGFSDPVVVIDKNFIIQRINKVMLSTLEGKSFQSFIGKHCFEVIHGLKDRCPQCTAPISFASAEKTERPGFI